MNKLISLLSLSFLFSFSSISSAHDLMAAIQSEDRSPKNIARDEYRNPAKTLTFFQIQPDMRKAGLIAMAVVGSALFMSCSSSKTASNGYFGVSSHKANKKQQKEFKKPKHKIGTTKATKGGN